jgi:hypothetical protein
MTIGVSLFLSGSGPYSLDAFLYRRLPTLANHAWFGWLVSPELAFIHDYKHGKIYAVILSIAMLFFTLYTNQHFVGGVYGPFHNPAVVPHLNLEAQITQKGDLFLGIYRNQGPDTYGSFIVDVKILNDKKQIISEYNANALGNLQDNQIQNYYLVKAKANGHALVIPLSTLALVQLSAKQPLDLVDGIYDVVVTDVSGLKWQTRAQWIKSSQQHKPLQEITHDLINLAHSKQ